MSSPQATLIFDGRCAYCRGWVERVRRWDRERRLDFVPYQTPDLEQRFPGVSRAECTQRIHLVDETGRVHRGAAAAREVLRRLPGGGVWTLPFRLPGGLALGDHLYAWVAHRWGPLPRADR